VSLPLSRIHPGGAWVPGSPGGDWAAATTGTGGRRRVVAVRQINERRAHYASLLSDYYA